MTTSSFHCCASCIHFKVIKRTKKGASIYNEEENLIDPHLSHYQRNITYQCSRLGFETIPTYQFNCWTPKDQVVKLMSKKNSTKS